MMRLLSSLLLALCVVGAPAIASAELRVVTTLPDLGAIAQAVGGDRVHVDVLAAPTEDPHYVDPRPSHLVTLRRADVLIANGLGLEEGWLPPLQVQARNPDIQQGGLGYFVASDHVPHLVGVEVRVDRSLGDVHPGGNPHFTFDARAGATIAAGMGELFARVDAGHADAYRAQAARFVAELEAFAASERERFASLAADRRQAVVYHDSLPYLLEWLGIDQVATLEPLPGVPPDPARVAEIIGLMRSTGAAVLLQEAYYPRTTSRRVTELANAELIVFDGGADLASGESYVEHLQSITDALYQVLTP